MERVTWKSFTKKLVPYEGSKGWIEILHVDREEHLRQGKARCDDTNSQRRIEQSETDVCLVCARH